MTGNEGGLFHDDRNCQAPRVAFGAGGEGSIRICYAAEMAILEQAMARLGEFMKKR